MVNQAEIPDDVQSLRRLVVELIETIQKSTQEVQELRELLRLYKQKLYGPKSERQFDDPGQLHLFGSESMPSPEPPPGPEVVSPRRKRRAKRKKQYPDSLPRQIREMDVPEDQRVCPCCGDEMPIIGTDTTEQLDLVPAKLFVIETRRHKRGCGKCKETIAQVAVGDDPDGPVSPVPGSDYGFGVYTQVIVGKFADHLPLYRIEDIFARSGVVIPRSTLCGMLANIADLITPFLVHMTQAILQGSVLGVDDTSVRMQDASLPGRMRTARFWLYRGQQDHPYNVFEFHDSRSRHGPAAFLQDFEGWAIVDAYGVNDGVYLGSGGRVMASCCNAHARRKFVEAKPNDPVAAAHALSFYRGLYDIEDRAREMTPQDRSQLRQQESAVIMQDLYRWLVAKKEDTRVLPKSSLGKAVGYALNQWQELTAFLSDGNLPIDNNDTERELRRLTIGRKNWLFVGSQNGGEVAAKLYSLVSSATRHRLDVWAYVDDVLRQLASGSTDYDSLLPDRWRQAHPASVADYRESESTQRKLTVQQRRARRREIVDELSR